MLFSSDILVCGVIEEKEEQEEGKEKEEGM